MAHSTSSSNDKEWISPLKDYVSKKTAKKIKNMGKKKFSNLRKSRAKNILRKSIKKRIARKKETAKRKKKKEAASYRTKVKRGAYSKASQKRMQQPLSAKSLNYVPELKKTAKKKLSFKETIHGLSGKKAKSTLRANASEWGTHNVSKWVPESLRGIRSRMKTLSKKIVPTGRKKTRRRRGMVSLGIDPSRMRKFSGLHKYLTVPSNGIDMFRTAANLSIRDLNRLRLTDYKTFMTLDPRSLNPNVQRYFRTFYENARPGYAIPFTSNIGAERARLMLEKGITKEQAKSIKKSLYADQNPDLYGVDDWEHAAAMDASRKVPNKSNEHSRKINRKLLNVEERLYKLKQRLLMLRNKNRFSMKDRLLNNLFIVRKDGERTSGKEARWIVGDDGKTYYGLTNLDRGISKPLPEHLEIVTAREYGAYVDKDIAEVIKEINNLKQRRKELFSEYREIFPEGARNFGPYLRNRYDEMREIPYQERTQQQRDEKDRLLKQMIKHGVSLPSTDSDSSFDHYEGHLGLGNEEIISKKYADRGGPHSGYIGPARKHGPPGRYRPMGYSEKRADRSKYFSRIANEKSQAASKMAAISAQRALYLANQSARNRERTLNAFTGNNIRGLTKLQSMYRRNKQMSRYNDLRRSKAATRIQALQRARPSRKLFKDKKYYEKILPNGKGIYRRGVLVRCIDPDNSQYQKYGYIKSALFIDEIMGDEEYVVHFMGSRFGDYRLRKSQFVPVFQFDSTSIPEAEWIISLPESEATPPSPAPSFSSDDEAFRYPDIDSGDSDDPF